MAPKVSGKNTRSSKRDVIYPPARCLQDNTEVGSDTEIDSENDSEMSQSLFKTTENKPKKKTLNSKRKKTDKVPICVLKTKHHRVMLSKTQDEETDETEQDGQVIISDIEQDKDVNSGKPQPVFVIQNNMTHPPTDDAGGNSESGRLAALGLTPSKTHKAQSSPTKSPKTTKGK